MTFDDILDQVITLLKRQGRVSYRALKMRFNLDDEYLDVLKEELLYVHPVRDDEGRGLVWTGAGEGTLDTPVPPPQAIPSPPTQATPCVEAASPVVTSRPPEAERRQLTVMFCDLVDSTTLSGQLDPEDWRDVVRAYQTVCTTVIQRYEGYTAQLLGDGLLVYFGYPQAHEDDAHRAVRTGLGILAAMEDLNKGLPQTKGLQLAVRVGIHTGLVVVGAMGGRSRQEQLALGETPILLPESRGWLRPIPLSSVTRRSAWGRGIFSVRTWEPTPCVASPSPCTSTTCSVGVGSRTDSRSFLQGD
jgi:adenylate/guanylate cyclase family protein